MYKKTYNLTFDPQILSKKLIFTIRDNKRLSV